MNLSTSFNLGNCICSFGASPFKGTSFLNASITSSILFSFSILLFELIGPNEKKIRIHKSLQKEEERNKRSSF
jgi:hypothetical protein